MSASDQTNVSLLRLNLEGDLSRISPAAGQLQEFLRGHGCPERVRSECELIMVEACNNAIKHAEPQGAWKPVSVEVRVEGGRIEIRIIDHGPGFEWPRNASLPEPDQESGRGVFLINALADYVAYERQGDQNVLVLRKNFCATVLPRTVAE